MAFIDPLIWVDDSRDPSNAFTVTDGPGGTKIIERAGTVIQQGTPQSAANFNAMVNAGYEALVMANALAQESKQHQRSIAALNEEFIGQVVEVTMNNTLKYPFNDSKKTVAITTRDNLDYRVEVEVVTPVNNIGDFVITDKQVNGFKIAFTGSASQVTVRCYITGGAKLYG